MFNEKQKRLDKKQKKFQKKAKCFIVLVLSG